ncbi:protein-tyrosine sulfotransferase-like isoform X3 [Juglans microcarpa x Juglans regia]|uniref:protein-tyrosine sulfotransferase-like isoform X3 n=1 Tax=Juglans microcarpa x Juglans regia TaxID=2249226 RepID=UPI001B7EF8F1|nr:protein-tyrosine sulfotransferase-like isoform X3 [Juglans microcarpa x Juglans regia]
MRLMDHTLRFSLLLTLLGFASILANASPIKDNFGHCERVVKKWAVSSLDPEVNEDKHTLRDLLFFLHVPRTGGRTYFHCFLRRLYSKSLECPRSYDKLRFDPSKTKCRLLVTHDDYSMMSKLPSHRTSVVTILRNPVERVFSTYEFSIEVGARFLLHPNLTSATQMAGRLRSKMRGVSTLDIWPWKYLVPWMREDLFARRDARRRRGSDDMQSNGSYDMEEIVMPLHEYINSPIALDIVHNGATFQVAGLTNNSYLEESHEVRHCVQKHEILGEHVLQVAKVISQWGASNMSMENVANNKSEQSSSFSNSELENDDHQNSSFDHNAGQVTSTENDEATKQNMTVDRLMEAYEVCISSLRKEQAHRRTASLKRISPANFSKEGRLQVPGVILEQIRSLNRLDLELYKYAQDIFEKRHKHTMEKLFAIERWGSMFNNSDGAVFWKVYSLASTLILLFLFLFLFVNARRRTSKVKS